LKVAIGSIASDRWRLGWCRPLVTQDQRMPMPRPPD
jgi:hypothetical protein